ncbi:MAG: hypothetical protein L0Z62_21090 [Gemmataceae bacterium]|nr:hypothetical protein [Gemmataceae bacterium]
MAAFFSRPKRRRPTRTGRASFRPRLEPLEDRAVPSAGDLDPTFGIGGKVTTGFAFQTADRAHDLVIQPDGKIVVVGNSQGAVALARYDPNGSLDATFGRGGTTIEAGARNRFFPATANAVALQADGKIVVAGRNSSFLGGGFFVARYNTNGSLDDGGANDSTPGDSFGIGGRVAPGFGEEAVDLAIQPDGKIVVAGSGYGITLANFGFALARYNPDGAPDPSFGEGGFVITQISGPSQAGDQFSFASASALALQPDGRILVAGTAVFGDSDFALVRYHSDGSLDTSFSADGVVTTNFAINTGFTPNVSGTHDQAQALAVQPDGKIVVVGLTESGFSNVLGLARYESNGALDGTFGTGGKVVTDLYPGNYGEEALAVAIQASGRIVVAGTAWVWTPSGPIGDFVLARYASNGSLDPRFGSNGAVTTDFRGLRDGAAALAIQADGKIVAAGVAQIPTGDPFLTDHDFALARYEGIGTIDQATLQVQALVGDVQALVAAGVLNTGQGNSLLMKLQATIEHIDGGNLTTAVTQLRAFQDQVNGLTGRVLSAAQGGALIDTAQEVIDLLVEELLPPL